MHPLSCAWVLWAHLPHEANWKLDSYVQIMKVECVEEVVALVQAIPDKLVTDCMFFFMKEHVTPTWEDVHNKHGGCFSYKIAKQIQTCWQDIIYSVSGGSLTLNEDFNNTITGVSISPKKNFCIIKVWMSNCKHVDATKIKLFKSTGCIFKKM